MLPLSFTNWRPQPHICVLERCAIHFSAMWNMKTSKVRECPGNRVQCDFKIYANRNFNNAKIVPDLFMAIENKKKQK